MASELFRSALNGFNRTDVVQFIQQQTMEHEKNLRVLRDENRNLKQCIADGVSERESLLKEKQDLEEELAALREKLAELEQKEASALERPIAPVLPNSFDEMELTAYRRAELTERMARERAQASTERMKQILAQGFEKITLLEGDYSVLLDACRNDFSQMQELLRSAREILSESSDGMRAAQALCDSI